MSRHEDRKRALDEASKVYVPKGHPEAVLMSERLQALVEFYAKPDPAKRAYYPKKEFSNTTVQLFLVVDGKGKRGDRRYIKPTICPRTGREKYDGKGVFVAAAHLKGVNGAEYGEDGTFEMPLSVAIGLGYIRGREAAA
jgi:hypothetical protein